MQKPVTNESKNDIKSVACCDRGNDIAENPPSSYRYTLLTRKLVATLLIILAPILLILASSATSAIAQTPTPTSTPSLWLECVYGSYSTSGSSQHGWADGFITYTSDMTGVYNSFDTWNLPPGSAGDLRSGGCGSGQNIVIYPVGEGTNNPVACCDRVGGSACATLGYSSTYQGDINGGWTSGIINGGHAFDQPGASWSSHVCAIHYSVAPTSTTPTPTPTPAGLPYCYNADPSMDNRDAWTVGGDVVFAGGSAWFGPGASVSQDVYLPEGNYVLRVAHQKVSGEGETGLMGGEWAGQGGIGVVYQSWNTFASPIESTGGSGTLEVLYSNESDGVMEVDHICIGLGAGQPITTPVPTVTPTVTPTPTPPSQQPVPTCGAFPGYPSPWYDVSGWLQWIGLVIYWLWCQLSVILTMIYNAIVALYNILAAIVADILEAIQDALEWLWTTYLEAMLQSIVDAIGGIVSGITSLFQDVIDAILAFLADPWTVIEAFFQSVIDAVLAFLADPFGVLTAWFESLWTNTIAPFLTDLIDALGLDGLIEWWNTNILPIINDMATYSENAIEWMEYYAGTLINNVIGQVNLLVCSFTYYGNVFTGWVTTIGPWIAYHVTVLGNQIIELSGLLWNAMQSFWNIIRQGFDWFTQAVPLTGSWIGYYLTVLGNEIKELAGVLWNYMIPSGDMLADLWNWFTAAVPMIGSWVGYYVTVLVGNTTIEFAGLLYYLITALWEWFVQWFIDTVSFLVSWISAILVTIPGGKLLYDILNAIGYLWSKFVQIWDAAYGLFANMWYILTQLTMILLNGINNPNIDLLIEIEESPLWYGIQLVNDVLAETPYEYFGIIACVILIIRFAIWFLEEVSGEA